MPSKIFVNLPVRDLKTSVDFFRHLGYRFDPDFTNENATCMLLGGDHYAMLLVEPFFRTFTPKPVIDAHAGSEVIIALSMDSRTEVDRIVNEGFAAGAMRVREPQDLGFMYSRSFADPDGHIWEYFWMDPSKKPE